MISIICLYSCEKDDNQKNILPKTYYDYDEFVTDGLVAYFPFNGNVEDISGNRQKGSGNFLTYNFDRFDNLDGACYFNGSNSYVRIKNSDPLNDNSYTICFWFKPDLQNTSIKSILSKSDTTGNGYIVGMSNSGNFSNFNFGIRKDSSIHSWAFGRHWFDDVDAGSEQKYKFVAFTFSLEEYRDTSETVFIDYFGGTKVHLKHNPATLFNANNYDLYVGTSENTRYKKFKGEIDDLLMYNRILTYKEIEKLSKWNTE
jgi:hypothetical protein